MQVSIFDQNLQTRGLSLQALRDEIAQYGFADHPAVVHGSVLSERFDEFSDIDIMIVTQRPGLFQEIRLIKGARLDICIININRLLAEMSAEVSKGWDGLARTIVNGFILSGNWEVLHKHAAQLIRQAPEASIDKANNRLASLLSDLYRKSSTSILERVWFCNELISIVGDIHLRSNGKWSTGGRELVLRFEAVHSDEAEALTQIANRFIATGRPTEFERFISERLGIEPRQFKNHRFAH